MLYYPPAPAVPTISGTSVRRSSRVLATSGSAGTAQDGLSLRSPAPFTNPARFSRLCDHASRRRFGGVWCGHHFGKVFGRSISVWSRFAFDTTWGAGRRRVESQPRVEKEEGRRERLALLFLIVVEKVKAGERRNGRTPSVWRRCHPPPPGFRQTGPTDTPT